MKPFQETILSQESGMAIVVFHLGQFGPGYLPDEALDLGLDKIADTGSEGAVVFGVWDRPFSGLLH